MRPCDAISINPATRINSHNGQRVNNPFVCCIPLALGVQDLLDMEQIDEIEWSMGSDDEDDECMEIDDG